MLSAPCLVALVLSASPDAGVPAVMHEALQSVVTMAPWLPSPDAFRDPKNQKAIGQSLDALARLQHPFARGPGTSSAGVATLFARQASAARADFNAGRTEPARYRVEAMTRLCVDCHLREPARDFADAAKVVEGLKLPPLQQARFYAITREVDRALALWRAELPRPTTLDSELFEELDGLRLAVEVAVRSRDDAKLVQQLLAPQLKRSEIPGFAFRELKAWQKDATAWDKERFVLAAQKPAALVARAKALIEKSGAEQNVAALPEQFLTLVRAASYLDEAMRREPDAAFRGQALYLLGVAHASVSDVPLWQLEWMYFEACIRESPGTPQAVACAERLKARTWYTWRRRIDMPAGIETALGELVALSKSKPD